MDQSVIAGIGNIFRSEILWRQGVHPKTPGNAIDETTFNKIWEDARDLLALAVKHNSIITVQDGKPSSGKYRERVNVYKKTRCPKCGGGSSVTIWRAGKLMPAKNVSRFVSAGREYPNG